MRTLALVMLLSGCGPAEDASDAGQDAGEVYLDRADPSAPVNPCDKRSTPAACRGDASRGDAG